MQSKEPDYNRISAKIDSLVPEKTAIEKQLERLHDSLLAAYNRGVSVNALSKTLKAEGVNASPMRLRKLLLPQKPRKPRQKKEIHNEVKNFS
jgi:hypothetical protein